MQALGNTDAQLAVFMQTPELAQVFGRFNPLFILLTGLRLKAGKFDLPVSVYFGHGRFQGRFSGVGVVGGTSVTQRKRPHQFFRMDWHTPHTASSESQAHYWVTIG